MNTIKFAKKENLTTEQHNLEITDIYKENIFGQTLNIYHPCNLNIFVTNICNNNCFFCVNGNFLNTDITDEEYLKGLEKTLKELKGREIEITITGGEPTINPKRFVETLKMCNKFGFPCRTVSTTGYNLLNEYQEKILAQYLIENNFVHNINISRMSTDEILNTDIFCEKDKNISNKDIEKLAKFFKYNDAEMRISCNLINGYVDDFNKMLDFVSFYRKKSVETIMFRELEGIKNTIKLKDIVRFDNNFKYIETLKGIFYTVKVYEYKDMIIKYYETNKNLPQNVIASLSLRNNILSNGFRGNIFRKDLNND